MLFNTFEFMYFFIVIVLLYFIIPKRFSWFLLLCASYYFYMCWKPEYILLIVFSTLIDYFASIRMSKLNDQKKRRKYLILSLCTNLGLLFTFKYFNFFLGSIQTGFNVIGQDVSFPVLNVLLPVGISFYTFQTLSYTIDVYMGRVEAEKHLGIFALYVSFFPQLVAGPIERSTHLLPQLREKHKFDWDRIKDGLTLMLFGFFKKVVIADNVAILVEQVYGTPQAYTGLPLIIATIFFAFQIYCDFSGYSDIAIGTAKVLGVDLMRNFNKPYLARSIQDFWRRWHISLSTWFKDYLYIPLGGNRVRKSRWVFNLFITFTLSGLWHGASFTFVIWGALNGVYLILGQVLKPVKAQLRKFFGFRDESFFYKLFSWAFTMCLVLIGWVFFRAESLSDAIYVLTHLNGVMDFNLIYDLGLTKPQLHVTLISIFVLMFIEIIDHENIGIWLVKKEPLLLRYAVYYAFIVAIILFGVYGNYDPAKFIYFAF